MNATRQATEQPFVVVKALLLGMLVLGCATACRSSSGPAARVDLNAPESSFDLSRSGFVGELLDARATARTPRFDDYTAGSYHVVKADLLAAIERVAADDEELLGALAVGPFGPLWAYELFVFRDVENGVRVNRLLMPHARITFKGTSLASRREFDRFVRELSRIATFAEAYPAVADSEYGLAAVLLHPARRRAHVTFSWYDSDLPEQAARPIEELLQGLLKDEVVTYSTDLPEDRAVGHQPNLRRRRSPDGPRSDQPPPRP